ncbi:penicillin acylase family protein [Salinifilum ghardaiensis]
MARRRSARRTGRELAARVRPARLRWGRWGGAGSRSGAGRWGRATALALAAVLTGGLAAPAAGAQEGAGAPPDGPTDYCGDRCDHILPPGQNGNATFGDLVGHILLGAKPPHSDDQLEPYARLADGYRELDTATIDRFFRDNSFGVEEQDVAREYQPRQDVTVVRDEQLGVPHIYGETRAGTSFGAGYATAEDKLFLMDVLRHAGRGQVSSFAGGAEQNRELEQRFFATAPYTEHELRAQIARVAEQGERGEQALRDAKSYVEGINAYVEHARENRDFPGEYAATGHVDPITDEGEIEPFRLTDLVVLAALVGAQFGSGGGGEVENAVARMELQERFGPERGDRAWRTFQAQEHPGATTTVRGARFPYGQSPEDPEGMALPDPGSVVEQDITVDERGTAAESGEGSTAPPQPRGDPREHPREALRGMFSDGVVPEGLARQRGMSNALVVSGEHTESGHPIAVFGPQTGYFAPQLLTLQELRGPGISSRGASFAGLSFYTLLGRGQDYAWSATSAQQDIVDTYAVRLCEPDGSAPSRSSDHYEFRGECVPMRTVERENSWEPTLGDSTGPGSYTLRSYRTAHGPVTHRATVDGHPVAYAAARSTFLHEVDSITGFQKFNDPSAIRSAADFQRAAADVNFTFNWFYADDRDTAHYNSGANVVRPPHVDPSLPIASAPANEWRGWNPADNTAERTPAEQHPQARNQDYFVDWNNKQAAGTAAAQPNKGSVQRVDLLDRRVRALVERGGVDRADVVGAMMDAGLTDLRAERLLPALLRIIDSAPVDDPRTAALVEELRDWRESGGKRAESEPGGREYAHAEAIRLMDAWWPRLVRGVFQPAVGEEAFTALTATTGVNQSPSGWQNADPDRQVGQGHQGSAFQSGWYGQVFDDLRTVLGEDVPGGPARAKCGGGELEQCRAVLLDALRRAERTPPEQTYPGDDTCEAGDQWCADALVHSELGGIGHEPISWQNRPTYQQVVEFRSHRGR